MGFFRLKNKVKLAEISKDDKLPESDFSCLTETGDFVQLEYIDDEEKKLEPYKVHPGIWAIQKTMIGLQLYKTSFAEDTILESFAQTKDITDKIDCFFRRIDVYRKRHPNVTPMRRMLLFGPPGTGKSTSLNLSAKKYGSDGKSAVIVWHTDKFEAYQVKDFIKSFSYVGVERMILIVEDIGGLENDNGSRPSESSLLSLLDNKENVFTIPTMIIATTNYPNVFKGNLTNRPGRFADKIKVGFPKANERKELLKFFAQGQEITKDVFDLVSSDKCKEFTADHIREIFDRADLYEKSFLTVTKELITEIGEYNKNFDEGAGRMGIFND